MTHWLVSGWLDPLSDGYQLGTNGTARGPSNRRFAARNAVAWIEWRWESAGIDFRERTSERRIESSLWPFFAPELWPSMWGRALVLSRTWPLRIDRGWGGGFNGFVTWSFPESMVDSAVSSEDPHTVWSFKQWYSDFGVQMHTKEFIYWIKLRKKVLSLSCVPCTCSSGRFVYTKYANCSTTRPNEKQDIVLNI